MTAGNARSGPPTTAGLVVRGLTQERRWAIVVLENSVDELLDGRPVGRRALLTPETRDVYWADPFPFRDGRGRLWIFVEELHRWTGLGSIVALRVEGDAVAERRTVLSGRHHYSFPQVQLWDGTIVATVESCDPRARTYTFAEVGGPWLPTLRTVPIGVIDPALAMDGDDWFLLGTSGSDYFAGFRQWQAEFGVGFVEQPELRYRDAALARSAGNADVNRGIRSVQDCRENYGIATALTTWSPSQVGPGEVLRRLNGSDVHPQALGTHTLTWTPDGQVVVADVWARGPQPLSAVHRLAERRHGRFCAGRRLSAHMP